MQMALWRPSSQQRNILIDRRYGRLIFTYKALSSQATCWRIVKISAGCVGFIGLWILWILDLDPMGRGLLGHFIWRILSLADDAFQVHFHDFFKEKCDLNHKMAVTATLCFPNDNDGRRAHGHPYVTVVSATLISR